MRDDLVHRIDVEHSLFDEHRFDGCDARLNGCELFGMVVVRHHASCRYLSNRSMCTKSPSVPASPHSSRDVKRTEYSGSTTNPPPCASMSSTRWQRGRSARWCRACPGRSEVRGCGRGDAARAPARCRRSRISAWSADTRSAGSTPRSGRDSGKCPPARRSSSSWRRHARFDSERRDTGEPVLPVRRRQVVRGIHPLDRMAKHAAVDAERSERSDHHPKGASLPVRGEERLAVGVLDRAETVQSAEVVHTVHFGIIRISAPKRSTSPDRGTSGSSGLRAGWPTYISPLSRHSYLIAGNNRPEN